MPSRRRRSTPENGEPLATSPEPASSAPENDAGSQEETPQELSPAPKRRARRRSAKAAGAESEPAPVTSERGTVSTEPVPVGEVAGGELQAQQSAQSPGEEQAALVPVSGTELPARKKRTSTRRRAKSAAVSTEEVEAEVPPPVVEQTPEETVPAAEETPSLSAEHLVEEAPAEEPPVPEPPPEVGEPSLEAIAPAEGLTGLETVLETPSEVTPPPVRPRRRTRRTAKAEPEEIPHAEPAAERKEPEPRRRRREGVRLGIRQGHPEIIIDGQPVVPLFFFGNIDSAASERRVCEQMRQAASAGVHLHALLLELPVSVPMVSFSVNEALRLLHLVHQHDPQGYVMFRVVFTPPPDWQKLYPEAMTTYADGSTGEPSFASDRYWQEAEAALTLLVRQLEVTEESRYILGYHLDCREWFYEYQRGYDYSPAAQEAFRQWLRARYKNDIVRLRAAWHDGSVTFTSASIPTYRGDAAAATVLYDSRKGQRYVDYLCFASETIARRIVNLSRTVKKNCDDRRLVAVSYGYVLDFPVPHSGHLALSEVLSAQSIDLICAPVSYRDRWPTQPGSIPVPVGSVRLHNKLFILEDDTKPHTAQGNTPDDYNPRCSDAESTRQVRLRNATTALVHHAGVSWMDLWGEGWLNDSEVWQQAGKLSTLYLAHIRQRLPEMPEVAVIVDERSLTRIQSPQALLEPLIIGQQEVLARAGIHYGIYLQSDLVRKAFPEAKMYLFIDPIQIDSEVREAIRERLQRDGKTLVWLYAVALFDEKGYTPDGPRDVAGIAIKAQPWNSETGSIISNDRHPISERLRNKQVGIRERVNPSFYVLDEKAVVLGEYIQTGLPSIAVKDMGSWRSVFIGERQLSVDLLRGLCRFAGVHVWSQSSDVVRVAPPFLAVHSVGDGVVYLQLPQKQVVYDLTEHRLLAEDAVNLRLNMRTGQTGLYVVGGYEHLQALGISIPERSEEIGAEPSVPTGKKRRRRGGRKHRKKRD